MHHTFFKALNCYKKCRFIYSDKLIIKPVLELETGLTILKNHVQARPMVIRKSCEFDGRLQIEIANLLTDEGVLVKKRGKGDD